MSMNHSEGAILSGTPPCRAFLVIAAKAPALRPFDPTRRAVLTTDASNVAVAAILTHPDSDDEGHQHPGAGGVREP